VEEETAKKEEAEAGAAEEKAAGVESVAMLCAKN